VAHAYVQAGRSNSPILQNSVIMTCRLVCVQKMMRIHCQWPAGTQLGTQCLCQVGWLEG
jgi:hypothetical protein